MAARLPLVVVSGQVQQLQAGDSITTSDPAVGSYAPGAFSLAAGQYAQMAKRLILTTTQRVTLAGDSCLRIN